MNWNHRILAHEHGEYVSFEIHEVYYDKDGKPEGCTKNSVSVSAESIEGIKWVLDKMRECIDKPVLSAKNFPDEYKM